MSLKCFTFVKSKVNGSLSTIFTYMDMKDRIRLIMEDQHMTQQVFADYLQQSPATLSSIFNGRTRPTLNIVEAIKKKIPDINTDWLLWGTGDMHLPQPTSQEEPPVTPQEQPVGGSDQLLNFEQPSLFPTQQVGQPTGFRQSVRSTHPEIVREEIKIVDKQPRKVTEIRVYYDDQTYETFAPVKR